MCQTVPLCADRKGGEWMFRSERKSEILQDWGTLSCQEVKGFFQQLASFPLEMDKKFTGFWSLEQSLTQKERWFQRTGAGLHIYRSQACLTGQRASKHENSSVWRRMASSDSYAKTSSLSGVCQLPKPQKAFVECWMEVWNPSHILLCYAN